MMTCLYNIGHYLGCKVCNLLLFKQFPLVSMIRTEKLVNL